MIIKCKNQIHKKDKILTCGRFLVDVSKPTLKSLKDNSSKLILRCPVCRVYKWIILYYNGEELIQESKSDYTFSDEANVDHIINVGEL